MLGKLSFLLLVFFIKTLSLLLCFSVVVLKKKIKIFNHVCLMNMQIWFSSAGENNTNNNTFILVSSIKKILFYDTSDFFSFFNCL